METIMIEDLMKLANGLDKLNLIAEANMIDGMMVKLSAKPWILKDPGDPDKGRDEAILLDTIRELTDDSYSFGDFPEDESTGEIKTPSFDDEDHNPVWNPNPFDDDLGLEKFGPDDETEEEDPEWLRERARAQTAYRDRLSREDTYDDLGKPQITWDD
jgi:hypothetical protein